MRKSIQLLILVITCYTSFSQTLFTFGKNAVSKEEFLKAYNKNKTVTTDKEKSLREYLDLYINFKLKVEAAKNARMDTLPSLKYDIQNFRNQIIESYLNKEEDVNKLVDEAFERSQKDIHVKHFLITPDSNNNSQTAEKLYFLLLKGEITDEEYAKNFPVKITDLGFVTTFSISYQFENIIYSLKPGEVSKPYLLKNKLHIFKNIDERKAIGKWKVAQILLALPNQEENDYFKKTQAKADSIYQLLKNGADFGELAKQFSNDKFTYLNNGELPEFGAGKYELSFENEVIKLKTDGEISKPFLTQNGFHIIKRIKQTPIPADKNKDESYWSELKRSVLQDSRINSVKEKFVEEFIKQIGYKKNNSIKDEELFRYADSVSIYKKEEAIKNSPVSNKTIFSFSKEDIKASNWLNFIKDYKGNSSIYKGESNEELLKKYINFAALEYYKKNLEKYNPQFDYQMKEFKEGNMLFEIMEQKVWNKAYSDSNALKKYYDANRNKYLWEKSAAAIIFNCPDIKTAKNATEIVSKNEHWKKYFEENNIQIQTDSGRYELSQLPAENVNNFYTEFISKPIANNIDNTASFVKIVKIYPAGQQRTFDEAKGSVVNDFQNKIEQEWITALKKKYPIKINEATFTALLKE